MNSPTGVRSQLRNPVIAEFFELPIDYFAEYRHAVVVEAIASDRKLRDRIYASLARRHR